MIHFEKHPSDMRAGDRFAHRNSHGVELVIEVVEAGPRTERDRPPLPWQSLMRFSDLDVELVLEGRHFK